MNPFDGVGDAAARLTEMFALNNNGPCACTGMPLSPQLYAYVDAKLLRIQNFVAGELNQEHWFIRAHPDSSRAELEALQAAYGALTGIRKDLKYEYLGLKDSWL